MSEKVPNKVEDFFNSISIITLAKIAGLIVFLLFITTAFSSATSWMNPMSWFQSSREELVEENATLQLKIDELEVGNVGEDQTKWEWTTGNHDRVNAIDSLRNAGK